MDLNKFVRVLDKAKCLVEIWRTHGAHYAATVFCDFAEHNPTALVVYAKFVARMALEISRKPVPDVVQVEQQLARMSDVIERKRS